MTASKLRAVMAGIPILDHHCHAIAKDVDDNILSAFSEANGKGPIAHPPVQLCIDSHHSHHSHMHILGSFSYTYSQINPIVTELYPIRIVRVVSNTILDELGRRSKKSLLKYLLAFLPVKNGRVNYYAMKIRSCEK